MTNSKIKKSRWLLAATLTMTAAAAGGCNYRLGDLHRKDVRTIAVPTWTRGRDVYRREVEIRLTEAIIKQIQNQTQFRIAGASAADTKLTGSIERISQQVLSINTDTGSVREMEVIFTVSFTWTDLRKGKELKKEDNFLAGGRYIEPEPFEEDFFEGSEDVINEVAKRIVEQLEEGW